MQVHLILLVQPYIDGLISFALARSLVMLIMVLTIATTGKLLGCALTARLLSIPWREAATLGVLMNTRG